MYKFVLNVFLKTLSVYNLKCLVVLISKLNIFLELGSIFDSRGFLHKVLNNLYSSRLFVRYTKYTLYYDLKVLVGLKDSISRFNVASIEKFVEKRFNLVLYTSL